MRALSLRQAAQLDLNNVPKDPKTIPLMRRNIFEAIYIYIYLINNNNNNNKTTYF